MSRKKHSCAETLSIVPDQLGSSDTVFAPVVELVDSLMLDCENCSRSCWREA
jgi:hypothetical protein